MNLNRKQYAVCFSLCILALALGFLFASLVTLPDFLLPQVKNQSFDRSLLNRVQTVSMFKFIFFNNSKVFFLFTVGILTCGIISIVQLLIIGGSLGLGIQLGMSQGAPLSLVLAILIPHGVLEITAFMIVAAIGFYFPINVYRHIQGVEIDWTEEIKTYGTLWLGGYLILLVAASIETFVTPSIAAKFLP